MPQQCRGEEAVQVSWLEPSEGEDRAGLRGFPLSKWFMVQGGLHSSVRLGPERDTQLQPAPILSSQKKGKTKTHQCMIQPQFEKQGHWHSLVKPRLKTYPRMHDLPKICQPCSVQTSCMTTATWRMKWNPMEIFDISTIMQCLGEKKNCWNSPSLPEWV